ncbi:sigma-70 family RNA polymerase sigma factor [Actinoallomurus rhizosphaericola]|uniref:sigma-70 family RNA polymerase sigma factor n=1 Tax=Actinoallomurus rhizosphaericola TaxID=2952536 RepID=UPI002092F2EA|nr:sigma-70 family RNA polymerase sigma factor [Actinoallomurus rhizosphaericola]MCO5998961.1 sigma-70 family RNA polymerase sigma factor [Actinoallomurus rhizosphaericola]
MAGWPTIDRAEDQRLAQALRAGHPTAMAEIYEAYAQRLYDYCHVLLRDQELAAQGLHDSLIIVQERGSVLPDPRLFRGWLYAVTRAECLRRRAETGIPEDRRKAREAEGLVEIDESTRRLVHAALMVLSSAQRELLDLALRHELDPHELAEVLNTTPQDVTLLVEQARNDLDDAFAAVVVAATGRDDCPSVPALAGPADRPLDAEACGRLARHIGNCPICGLRANRKVATARLLHAMPIAAVPAGLRARVLGTVTPEHAGLRAAVAGRFDPPRPAPHADEFDDDETRRRAGMWVALGAAACAVLALTGVFLVLPGSGGKADSGNQAAAAPSSGSPSGDPSESSPTGPSPSRSEKPHTPTPTPTPTPKKSRTPKPMHTLGRPRTTAPAPASSAPQPSSTTGTLTVAGCDMRYSGRCKVRVTAKGGPVHWAVSGTNGAVQASGDGDLGAGDSAYVTVSRTYKDWCFTENTGSVSFSPGSSADVHWDC